MIHLDLPPSQDESHIWHYAIRDLQKDAEFSSNDKTGKWMIFLDTKDLDDAWDKIKRALRQGQLGPLAKCSTKMKNPSQVDMKESVIVCYTENFEDEKDLERVYQAIRKLGFKGELKYKKDITTKMRIYGDKSWHKVRPAHVDL